MPQRRGPHLSIVTTVPAATPPAAAEAGSLFGPRWRRALRLGLTVLLGTYVATASVLMLAVDHRSTTAAAAAPSMAGSYQVLSGAFMDYVRAKVRTVASGSHPSGGQRRGAVEQQQRQQQEEQGRDAMREEGRKGLKGFHVEIKEVIEPSTEEDEDDDAMDRAVQQHHHQQQQQQQQQEETEREPIVTSSSEVAGERRGDSGFYVRVKEVFNPPPPPAAAAGEGGKGGGKTEGGRIETRLPPPPPPPPPAAQQPPATRVDKPPVQLQQQQRQPAGEASLPKAAAPEPRESVGARREAEPPGPVEEAAAEGDDDLLPSPQPAVEEEEEPLRVSLKPAQEVVEKRYFVPLSSQDPLQLYIDEQARRMERGDNERLQFVAFVPDEGLGNRLRGAYSTFLLAVLLRRPFLLLWDKPCHWSLQMNNTMPWDWDMRSYPALQQAYESGSGRVLYMCLTQFLKGCEDRPMHRQALETANLTELYAQTDLLIVQDPDEYVSLLQANPFHGEEARAIVEWQAGGDAANRTYAERFVGRFLEPSAPVLAMMAPYRGKYTHAIHVRSQFCRGGDLGPLLSLVARHAPYPSAERAFFVAVDKAPAREALMQDLKQRVIEGEALELLTIDLPPVHSNDRLPQHASNDSYVSLMADLFLLAEAPGRRFLTDQSSFSEAVQFLSAGKPPRRAVQSLEEGGGLPSRDQWFCGRARDGRRPPTD